MNKIQLSINLTLLTLLFACFAQDVQAQTETTRNSIQNLPKTEFSKESWQNQLTDKSAAILKNKRPAFFSLDYETRKSESKSKVSLNINQNNYVRPTAGKRFQRYLNNTVGPFAFIGAGIGAGIAQADQNPPEWKKNTNGYLRRFASNVGENAIQETVAYGLEEALKLDSKFYKSKKKDFGSRVKNAFLSSFTARTPSGKRVFNPSRIIGTYTANIIAAEAWFPDRFNYQDGLRQGTKSVAFSIGFGFLREFLFPQK
jgi:hypothetical protein